MAESFSIDFFELSFLVEACIPPAPIARTHFWKNLTDRYWHEMDDKQRNMLHQWISQTPRYKQSLEKGDHDVAVFEHRFNPEYQYKVVASGTTYLAFFFEDEYWLSTNRRVVKDLITSVTKRDLHDTTEV